MVSYAIEPIGLIENRYLEKFGVPKQSGLILNEKSALKLDPKTVDFKSLEDLRVGQFLWVTFIFHETYPLSKTHVRPPRLGGNVKKSVYATRSPFRKNNLGLSLAKVESMALLDQGVIELCGLDTVSGTPVVDIRPYHPENDSPWDESPKLWFEGLKSEKFKVQWETDLVKNEDEVNFIEGVLALDPRPGYHEDPDRVYHIKLIHYAIKYSVENGIVWITSWENL